MLYITKNTKLPEKNETIFINYIFEKCDKMCFMLPNFQQKKCGKKMRNNKEYSDYIQKNSEFLETIKPHIVKQYISKDYFNMKYSYASNIIMINLCKEVKDALLSNPDLYQWQFPNLPEDLCFLLKGSNDCWLQIIAHEEECRIYCETEKDIEILNECGIKWFKGVGNFKISTPKMAND